MKMKKLLASALAAAMVFSSMVSTIVASADTTSVGTISAETVDIEVGATTFDADITIDFDPVVLAPHNIVTIKADGYTLDSVTVKEVIKATDSAEGTITVGEDGANGANYAEGKVLLEAPVDSKAPTVSQIVLTATFVEDDTANTAGTYTITVSGDDMTNKDLADLAITATNGVVNVHGAADAVDYDNTNHWNVCAIENCDLHKYNEAAHTLGDYVANEDGTTETATCTATCGYSVTQDIVADECDHADATLEYDVVDGNCVTTKVCPDCNEYSEVVYSATNIAVTPALNLSSGLAINFRIKIADVTAGTDVYGVINHDIYEGENTLAGTSDDVNIVPTVTGTAPNQRYQFRYESLAAKEMLSEIHVKIYATVEENVVLISSYDFVIADYLKSSYIDKNTVNKTLAADILRYGAESQKSFTYRTGALATAGVAEDAFSALPTTFTNTVTTQGTDNQVDLEPSTVLLNTVTLRFRANVITGVTADQLHYTLQYVNESGVSTTYTSVAGEVGYNGNGKKYQFDFSSLPVAIINDYYTITLWNGDTAIATMQYSFQSDAQAKYTAGHSNATLAQAIVAYSASAAARFKTTN